MSLEGLIDVAFDLADLIFMHDLVGCGQAKGIYAAAPGGTVARQVDTLYAPVMVHFDPLGSNCLASTTVINLLDRWTTTASASGILPLFPLVAILPAL